MSQPIHIQFLKGQDESFDEKVLPVGPVRSAVNVSLDRDGRFVRRPALKEKTLDTPDGLDWPAHHTFVSHGARSLMKFVDENGSRAVAQFVYKNGEELLHRHAGPSSCYRSVRHDFEEVQLRDGGSTFAPRVAVAASGIIARAQSAGEAPTGITGSFSVGDLVAFYDPRTMERLWDYRINGSDFFFPTPSDRHALAGSNVSGRFAWLVAYGDQMRVYVFESSPDFRLAESWLVPKPSSAGSSSRIGHPDIAFDSDSDTLIIASMTSTAFERTARLERYSMQGALLETLDTIDLPTGGSLARVDQHFCSLLVTHDYYWWGAVLNPADPAADGASHNMAIVPNHAPGGTLTRSTTLSFRLLTSIAFTQDPTDSERVTVHWGEQFLYKGTVDAPMVNWRTIVADYSRSVGLQNQRHSLGEHPVTGGHVLSNGSSSTRWASQLNYTRDSRESPSTRYPDQAYSRQVSVIGGGGQYEATLWAGLGAHGDYIGQWERSKDIPVPSRMAEVSFLPPVGISILDGVERAIYPLWVKVGGGLAQQGASGTGWVGDYDGDDLRYPYRTAVVFAMCDVDGAPGSQTRTQECAFPGGLFEADDGVACLAAGFAGPPEVREVDLHATDISGPGTPIEPLPDSDALWVVGKYFYAFVTEFIDANGRIYRSQPSPPAPLEVISAHQYFGWNVSIPVGVPAQGGAQRVALYVTEADGSTLYKQYSKHVPAGGEVYFALQGRPIGPTVTAGPEGEGIVIDPPESLYTQGNVLGNDPPPSCRHITRTRERVWCGGLAQPGRLQASKIIKHGIGHEFSNLDNFFVQLPETVTALGAMDDYCIAFTKKSIFAVSGGGPNDQGVGEFTTPQKLPGTVGCVDAASLVTHETGFFFQSERGLEFMPRGFAAPSWVGQPVRDTLKDYPYCFGGCYVPEDDSIRWLFSAFRDGHGDSAVENGAGRVVVLDIRSKNWFVYRYDLGDYSRALLGATEGDGGDQKLVRMAIGLQGQPGLQQEDDVEDFGEAGVLVKTGHIRTAGLNGWNYGRRVNLLGEFRADCDVTLRFAFNGKAWRSGDSYTWQLREADYEVGEAVELELTLPVQLYSSIRFELEWSSVEELREGHSFYANGITVFFEPTEEGPRVGARQKG